MFCVRHVLFSRRKLETRYCETPMPARRVIYGYRVPVRTNIPTNWQTDRPKAIRFWLLDPWNKRPISSTLRQWVLLRTSSFDNVLFRQHLEQNTTAGIRKIRTKEVMIGTEPQKEAIANAAPPRLSSPSSLSLSLTRFALCISACPLLCLTLFISGRLHTYVCSVFEYWIMWIFLLWIYVKEPGFLFHRRKLGSWSVVVDWNTQEPAGLKVSPLFLPAADGGFVTRARTH